MADEKHTIPYGGESINEALAWAIKYKDFDISQRRSVMGFLTADSSDELPAFPSQEERVTGYLISGELWLWNTKSGMWKNCGPISGGSSSAEVDPTVPSWAKQPNKPTYTAEEVGALPSSTPIPTVPANVSAFTNDAGYLTQHQDISGKEDKMGITATTATSLAAVVGTYYRFTADVGTLAVTLPTVTDTTKVASIVFYLTTGASPAVTFTSSHSVVYQEGFQLDASKTYEINCLFNGAAWVLMAAEINTGS